jgi:hypothetical protein
MAFVLAGALGVRSIVLASDHLDGPRVVATPQADIADVFAFTSPTDASHVVLAMTLLPFASSSATFSTQVDYVFRVRRVVAPSPFTLDDSVLDVACEFDSASPQNVTCSAPRGLQASAVVGDEAGGADPAGTFRVFAGRRSDPAFFDRQGALATLATERLSFSGQNAFAGANVLAIVVELDSVAAFGVADGGPGPMLAVAAETSQRGN